MADESHLSMVRKTLCELVVRQIAREALRACPEKSETKL